MIHTVLSRYEEKVNTKLEADLQDIGKLTIFCKGKAPREHEIALPNVGYEAQSFLFWIKLNSQSLDDDDIVTFAQYEQTDVNVETIVAMIEIVKRAGVASSALRVGEMIDTGAPWVKSPLNNVRSTAKKVGVNIPKERLCYPSTAFFSVNGKILKHVQSEVIDSALEYVSQPTNSKDRAKVIERLWFYLLGVDSCEPIQYCSFVKKMNYFVNSTRLTFSVHDMDKNVNMLKSVK